MAKFGPSWNLALRYPAFSFLPIFQVHAFAAEPCFGKMTKQKEPITQNIRNRREHRSRFEVMFYVIGSEKSKSGSASYSSRQQNQRRGGAVRYFQCTDTVSDKTDLHKICLNIYIQLLAVSNHLQLLYRQRHRLSIFAHEILAIELYLFYEQGRQHFLLSPLDCHTAEPSGLVNGGRSPFISIVDMGGRLCFLVSKQSLLILNFCFCNHLDAVNIYNTCRVILLYFFFRIKILYTIHAASMPIAAVPPTMARIAATIK